jgi:RNA polymerase-binding transcription factor DksA
VDLQGTAQERLLDERAAAQSQLAALTADVAAMIAASEGSNSDDEHDPEGATIAFERAQTQALVDAARRRLGEIEAALDRLSDGRYGACVACGRPIEGGRLEARPSAARCLACAT